MNLNLVTLLSRLPNVRRRNFFSFRVIAEEVPPEDGAHSLCPSALCGFYLLLSSSFPRRQSDDRACNAVLRRRLRVNVTLERDASSLSHDEIQDKCFTAGHAERIKQM